MRTRLKICCIASTEEAELAIQAGADALGLVGAMPSNHGPIADELIRTISGLTPPPVATFLLTSESSADAIAEHVERTGPTTVQIVRHIDPQQSERLAKLLPDVKRVQVIHVEDRGAIDLIEIYAPHVHAFLLDSGRPSATVAEFGGTGRVHDWDISAAFVAASPLPVFLAGGLNPTNVADAIRRVRPFGLDLCTGVRTDGRLDRDKLNAYVDAVRATDFELGAADIG